MIKFTEIILSKSDILRFMVKIQLPRDKINECWEWTAARYGNGYGGFRINSPRAIVYAHRVSYVIHKGLIPNGLVIDHLCRNRKCVNPNHLEAVTDHVNIVVRGTGLSAMESRQTHCKNGHPLSGDNLNQAMLKQGYRDCRTCRNAWARAYKAAKKAKRRISAISA